MILVCGATGELGGRIVREVADRGMPIRSAVRPRRRVDELTRLTTELVEVDFRDRSSLERAVRDVDTVVSGVSAMASLLTGGEGRDAFEAVDRAGHHALIEAAERAGVRRFVFVSLAGCDQMPAVPLARAKLAVERRLLASSMESVVVRPEAFQEIWLTPVAQLDWHAGRLVIFGRGEARMPYVAVADVAAAVATLALSDDPPRAIAFGGPEALTRNEVAGLIETVAGRQMKRRHVPRGVLWAGSKALARVKPGLASLMGFGLAMDLRDSPLDAEPLRRLGVAPRAGSDFIRDQLAHP